MYVYYNSNKFTKEIWDVLQKKYDVSRYMKYQMIDGKSVEAQSHELQKIAHKITSKGMTLDEQFQVAIIIDKLPPAWKDFKNTLRHKTKEFSLESLITRLRIDEEARKQDQRDEVLVVSNNSTNKKLSSTILKPKGRNMKTHNRSNNQNRHHQNRNRSYPPQNGPQPP